MEKNYMHDANFYKPMFLFHVIVTICSIIFIAGVFFNLKIILSGRPNTGPKFNSIIRSILRDSLLQIPLLKLSVFRWITHMLIFWGFIGLFIGTTRLFIYTDIYSHKWIIWGQDMACDISGIMLIAGIIFAFFRRTFSKSPVNLTEFEDGIMLFILFILGVTGFLVEGARIALTQGTVSEQSFLGIWLANFLKGISPVTATVFWTVHALASAFFIAYIPFSKLWHTFTAPITLSMNPEKYKGD